jgi:hypothetical protein
MISLRAERRTRSFSQPAHERKKLGNYTSTMHPQYTRKENAQVTSLERHE